MTQPEQRRPLPGQGTGGSQSDADSILAWLWLVSHQASDLVLDLRYYAGLLDDGELVSLALAAFELATALQIHVACYTRQTGKEAAP